VVWLLVDWSVRAPSSRPFAPYYSNRRPRSVTHLNCLVCLSRNCHCSVSERHSRAGNKRPWGPHLGTFVLYFNALLLVDLRLLTRQSIAVLVGSEGLLSRPKDGDRKMTGPFYCISIFGMQQGVFRIMWVACHRKAYTWRTASLKQPHHTLLPRLQAVSTSPSPSWLWTLYTLSDPDIVQSRIHHQRAATPQPQNLHEALNSLCMSTTPRLQSTGRIGQGTTSGDTLRQRYASFSYYA
jgi:hypothetical protein